MLSIGVYIDDHEVEGLCRLFLSTSGNLPISMESNPENYYFKHQFTEFINSNHAIKFAAFHINWPYTHDWIEELKILHRQVEHIFVISTELHDVIEQCLVDIDLPNVSIFIGGVTYAQGNHAHRFTFIDWFKRTTWVYNETGTEILIKKNNFSKQKYFEILLGARRIHRDFVYEYCKKNNLFTDNIITYYQNMNLNLGLANNSQFIIGNNHINFSNPINHTVKSISYRGVECPLSLVIPYEIYNQSYYSLVAETNAENHFSFFTEKIAKPILARRLFIAIAGHHYLKNLQSLGFKTFHGIINEEYDNEENHINRWQMAMEQVKFLTTQNPQHVYSQINDIIEHNFQHMININWEKSVHSRIKSVANNLIKQCIQKTL